MTAVTGAKVKPSDHPTKCNGVNGAATTAGSDTTTSGTFVNLAGTGAQTSFAFTKQFSSTFSRIKVEFHATLWVATAVAVGKFAVNINGTDYAVCQLSLPATLSHYQVSGTVYLPGIAAGSYTVQGRWARVSGTGTLTRDVNDWLSISAEEVSV